ncbi:hypothetical protein [uncultured Roseovarius sp.]|uniref:hypothetical protein n=1 Tax=Roseovarius sp. TaxID=1486281 RepID=UPI0025DF6B30|nr:hypothetical protein [uncultured Roseovarius sp.]
MSDTMLDKASGLEPPNDTSRSFGHWAAADAIAAARLWGKKDAPHRPETWFNFTTYLSKIS